MKQRQKAPSFQTHPNANLYIHIMKQLKWRIEAIQQQIKLLSENTCDINQLYLFEFCLLQIRFCCEVLAVGCIAVHPDVTRSKRLTKENDAERIIKQFERLKADFFPVAVKSRVDEKGHVTLEDVSAHALTKGELLGMYDKVFNYMHAGTLEKYQQSNPEFIDVNMIVNFTNRLVMLLNEHEYHYVWRGRKRVVHVMMKNHDGVVEFVEGQYDFAPIAGSSDQSAAQIR